MGTKQRGEITEQVTFASAKRTILYKLQQAIDFSPKGSIDAPIVVLVGYINSQPDLVTTSSCSGRVAVYCFNDSDRGNDRGQSAAPRDDALSGMGNAGNAEVVANYDVGTGASSNKGAGSWLYVNHGQADLGAVRAALATAWPGSSAYLKVEPFILHVQCASLASARRLLQVAIRSGFRESGIVIGVEGKTKTLVHVRSTSGLLEVPVRHSGIDVAVPSYIESLIGIANERFEAVNARRERFIQELRTEYGGPYGQHKPNGVLAVPKPQPIGTAVGALPQPVTCFDCGCTFASKNALHKMHLVQRSVEGGRTKQMCPNGRKLSAAVPEPATVWTRSACDGCGVPFDTRNALFKHLRKCTAAALKRIESASTSAGGMDAIRSCRSTVNMSDLSAADNARQSAHAFLTKIRGTLHRSAEQAREEHQQGAFTLLEEFGTAGSQEHPTLPLLRRYGHCAAFIPPCSSTLAHAVGGEGYVAVFGGVSAAHGHGRSGDVLLFDVATGVWLSSGAGLRIVSREPDNRKPCARTRAACASIRLPGQAHEVAQYSLLVFGGHSGPAHPLNDAWLLTLSPQSEGVEGTWHELSARAQHAIPVPRWSMTLTAEVSESSVLPMPACRVLLLAGREVSASLGDAWVAQVEVKAGAPIGAREKEGKGEVTYAILWTQVPSAPCPRFAHAACAVLLHARAPCVFVHGGHASPVVSVERNTAGREDILHDAWLWRWGVHEEGRDAWVPLRVVGPGPVAMHALSRWSHSAVPMRAQALSHAHGTEAEEHADDIILIGGHAYSPQHNQVQVLRINEAALTLTVTAVNASVSNDAYAGWVTHPSQQRGAAGYTYPLPNAFRVHPTAHTAAADHLPLLTRHAAVGIPSTRQIVAIGGGAVCFAFGSHFSAPIVASVDALLQSADANVLVQTIPARAMEGVVSADVNNPNTILVCAPHANVMRTAVKEAGLFDWARKVGPATGVVQVQVFPGAKVRVPSGSLLGVPVLSPMTFALLCGESQAESNEALGIIRAAMEDGQAVLCRAQLPFHSREAAPAGSASVPLQRSAPAGNDCGKGGVLTMARLREACSAWISGAGIGPAEMQALCDELPRKVEWIGDIALLPAGSMLHALWSEGRGMGDDQGQVPGVWGVVARVLNTRRIARHAEIDPGPTRASRVLMLRTVPLSPESYALPASGSGSQLPAGGHETWDAPAVIRACADVRRVDQNAGGWVCVRQGHVASDLDDRPAVMAAQVTIRYMFDVTRLMFSSGNVTEKARMGHPQGRARGREETVVDMYCGQGYFTLPLLMVAGAAHVHAADWNPDAIACLKLNLAANKVEAGRVTLWEGDNAQLARPGSPALGCADRVLLGLIPSSQGGWPTAVRMLRPLTGGMLHVHQNVHERDMEEFCGKVLPDTLLRLGREAGAPWACCMGTEGLLAPVRVCHVERVKSYAPNVWHVVVDVECGFLGP